MAESPAASEDKSTPLMRQYHSLKAQVPNALLLFRLGDFYELFYDDAVTAARELEITLTSRQKNEAGQGIPMCGVPHHAAENYIARLIARGYRVAVCEQMEDPRFTKKLVKREIARVITPGTATDSNLLKGRENNFLAAAIVRNGVAGIAHVDVSTGEFRVTEVDALEAGAALDAIGAREVLLHEGDKLSIAALHTPVEAWIFEPGYAERLLREQFRLLSLDGCGLGGKTVAVSAAGAVLHYLRETQKAALDHLDRPLFYERAGCMVLDAVTIRNLELFEPLFAGERKESTLIHVLDLTCTNMGARLLRSRLSRPAILLEEIEPRLQAVADFRNLTVGRGEVRRTLERISDLERLLAKVTVGTAGPRDLLAIGTSLAQVPRLNELLSQCESLSALRTRLDPVHELHTRLLTAISDSPPVHLADGGTIRDGYDRELDELRDLSKNSRQYIAAIEARERSRTGIASLKVRFNNVFGYYIEISKANLMNAPADYERKQTLVNAERFTTPELKELESKVLSAEEKIIELERDLFLELRGFTAERAQRIRATAAALAEIDVAAASAQVAAENRYTRPSFSDSGELRIAGGRHPVIEKLAEQQAERFIANDVHLDSNGDFIAIITGPNMGGKSTYLRQTALISIMAQAGCYVPAESASLPLVDRVFTRVGAADNLARGRSTFMVEMTETAAILNTATEQSLIVLDEIGRGTATYDGLSLAWAVVEYLHDRVRAKSLFATHYHELTELAGQLEGVRNLHVSVKEMPDGILFLRRVEPGAADKSYGIEVARLAALPAVVIERAREILRHHERSETVVTEELSPKKGLTAPVQISFFEPVHHEIAERIRKVAIDQLRPVDALQLLYDLQQELKRG